MAAPRPSGGHEGGLDWATRGFRWRDGARLVVFGRGAAEEALELLRSERLLPFALITTARAAAALPQLAGAASTVVHVPPGPVPEAASAAESALLTAPEPLTALVALGGGRVIDSCKALAAAAGLPCATMPTTLSGAEMSPFHRPLADGRGAAPSMPRLVLNDPRLSASQPVPMLTASAMNAFGHAMEALYAPGAGPVTSLAAVEAVRLLTRGLELAQSMGGAPAAGEGRDDLALGALLAGYAIAATGLGLHHALCQTIVRLTGAPHAAVNAVMAPHVLAFMLRAAPDELAPLVAVLAPDGDHNAAVRRIAGLAAAAGAVTLTQLGVPEARLPEIAHIAASRPELHRTPGSPDEAVVLEPLRAAL